MKTYSDNAVTKQDLNAIDDKQTKQIMQLRVAIAASFVVNIVVTLAFFISSTL